MSRGNHFRPGDKAEIMLSRGVAAMVAGRWNRTGHDQRVISADIRRFAPQQALARRQGYLPLVRLTFQVEILTIGETGE